MADIGNAETLLVLSQNFELLVGAAAGSTTPDKYVLMRDVKLSKDHPETRTNHGLTRVYGHAAPDISLNFKLSVSSDIFADIKIKSTRNARGVLPIHPYKIKCTSNNGTVKSLTINGAMTYYEVIKSDGDAEEPGDVEVRVRITDDIVTIT